MLVTSDINENFSSISNNNRDSNGYIDLSLVEINYNPNSREKVGMPDREKNWVKFGDGRVFLLKEENILDEERNATVYAELIVEELAKQAGIEAAHYDLYKKDGKYGVLSEYCLKENEEMYSLESLIGMNTESEFDFEKTDVIALQENMMEFLKNEGLTKQQIRKMLINFQKRMVFDLFIAHSDRHTENISFRVKNDGEQVAIDFAPIYDNENSLLLDMDESTLDALAGNMRAMREPTDIIAPKIANVLDEQRTNSQIWRDTLEDYCEVDEVYDYMMFLYDTLNIDSALQSVEDRIEAKIPESVKLVAKYSFEYRRKNIDRVMCMDDINLT